MDNNFMEYPSLSSFTPQYLNSVHNAKKRTLGRGTKRFTCGLDDAGVPGNGEIGGETACIGLCRAGKQHISTKID
jgi:hypothetical protein